MNTLGLFARRPEQGQCKTRLAAGIGHEAATELYAAFVRDLLTRLQNRSERFTAALTPDDEATRNWFAPLLQGSSELWFQPSGNLGERIDWFFQNAFNSGSQKVVLLGSDSPDLPESLIDQAFIQLGHADVVIAPASDGGYVLVGMKQSHPSLFDDIAWSSHRTLTDTLTAVRQRGLTSCLLNPWYDIDTVENLGTLLAMQQNSHPLAAGCPETRSCLERIWPIE